MGARALHRPLPSTPTRQEKNATRAREGFHSGQRLLPELILIRAFTANGRAKQAGRPQKALPRAQRRSVRCRRRQIVKQRTCHNRRKDLALEELERGAAAGGDEGDLVLHVPFGRGSGRVAATDDALLAAFVQLGDRVPHSLGALAEVIELKRAGRSVLDNGTGGENLVFEELRRLRSAVHALPALGDALGLRNHLDLLVS